MASYSRVHEQAQALARAGKAGACLSSPGGLIRGVVHTAPAVDMWRTQLENPTCGEKSFSAETLVFCRARQGESIPPLSVVIREDGHVW